MHDRSRTWTTSGLVDQYTLRAISIVASMYCLVGLFFPSMEFDAV